MMFAHYLDRKFYLLPEKGTVYIKRMYSVVEVIGDLITISEALIRVSR